MRRCARFRLAWLFLLLYAASPVFGETALWTKSYPSSSIVKFYVGNDGSSVIITGSFLEPSVYWFDRSGVLLASPTSHIHETFGVIYISKDELILGGRTAQNAKQIELHQFVGGVLESKVLAGTGTSTYSDNGLEYPYFLKNESVDGITTFTLLDLTNENTMKVVGDAVVSIQNKNMKIRWKSLNNAKYKVQTSTDLAIWTDYTEILDGTGSTLIVSIPLDEFADEFFARVVKL